MNAIEYAIARCANWLITESERRRLTLEEWWLFGALSPVVDRLAQQESKK
jgi:hypothetical protein